MLFAYVNPVRWSRKLSIKETINQLWDVRRPIILSLDKCCIPFSEPHEAVDFLQVQCEVIDFLKLQSTRALAAEEDLSFFVRTLTGKITEFTVPQSDTIAQVKLRVYEDVMNAYPEGEVELSSVRLIHTGRQMQDERTVSEYNLAQETTIFVALLPKDG